MNTSLKTLILETATEKKEIPFQKEMITPTVEVHFGSVSGEIAFTVTARNTEFLHRLILRQEIRPVESGDIFLKEGFQSWSYSAAQDPKNREKRSFADFVHRNQGNVGNKPTGKRGRPVSEQFCYLGNKKTDEGFFWGQNAPLNQHVSYRYDHSTGILEISWEFEQQLRPGQTIIADTVSIRKGNPVELQCLYFNNLQSAMHIDFNKSQRTGWCSWYYYFTDITPACILSNLEAAERHQLPIDFFQIDDGYQSTVGDWLRLKPAFNGQMEQLARQIKTAGYTPGLWVAPFIISRKSEHFHKKGWVLRDAQGKPAVAGLNPAWQGFYYALDLTHPEVRAYLTSVFETIRRWGYEYLKLDFMYAATLPGIHYDQSLSPAQILKSGMALIRKVVGKETSIVGCGMPISSAIGTVDAMRVSCDVSPHWGQVLRDRIFGSDSMIETRGALRNSLVRHAMHNRLWINDPDCLMLRDKDTKLTPTERRTLVDLLLTLGQMIVFSDDMSVYSDEEWNHLTMILTRFEQMKEGNIECPDLVESGCPSFLYNDRGILAAVNLGNRTKTCRLGEGFFRKRSIAKLKDLSSGETIRLEKGLSLYMEPHSSRLFETITIDQTS